MIFIAFILPLFRAQGDYRVFAGRHSRRNESGDEGEDYADHDQRRSSGRRKYRLERGDLRETYQYVVDRYQQQQARAYADDAGAEADYDGLRVATMHRVKGLEFQYVFVAAVNNRIVPLSSAINRTDAVSEAETMTSEKCLLYVALTRAQKGAYITSYGKQSEFVK